MNPDLSVLVALFLYHGGDACLAAGMAMLRKACELNVAWAAKQIQNPEDGPEPQEAARVGKHIDRAAVARCIRGVQEAPAVLGAKKSLS